MPRYLRTGECVERLDISDTWVTENVMNHLGFFLQAAALHMPACAGTAGIHHNPVLSVVRVCLFTRWKTTRTM
jgi:hypothetical protein